MKRERSEDIPPHHLDSTTMFHHHPPHEESDSHSHIPSHSRRNGAVHDDSLPLLLPPPPPPHSHDGATIEVSRRPRGRPPGSKNKPKPPVIITSDPPDPPMSPYVLELPPGADIIESTTRFCRKRSIGLCILNGNGAVSNVTLKQPSNTPGSTVTFHGLFELLSISSTILPAGCAAAGSGQFAISLAGPQGQVVGGLVVGPLVAAGSIYLVGATFNSPSFHRLQNFEHERDPEAVDGGGCEQSPQAAVPGGGDGNPGGGQSFCNYQTSSDVIWAPTARQPPPRY